MRICRAENACFGSEPLNATNLQTDMYCKSNSNKPADKIIMTTTVIIITDLYNTVSAHSETSAAGDVSSKAQSLFQQAFHHQFWF